jgi:hypothetical protein
VLVHGAGGALAERFSSSGKALLALGTAFAKDPSVVRICQPRKISNVHGDRTMKRRSLIKAFTLTASIAAMGMTWTVQAAETIKVGILHSVSGNMAISESSL